MRLACESWGPADAGASILLIHGVTSNRGSWTRVGPALARLGYHVVAPDLRAHGASPRGTGEFSLDALASDLLDTCDRSPDVVVGHSLGGAIGIIAVTSGLLTPRAIVLEDPALHISDRRFTERSVDDDEAARDRTIEEWIRLHPAWDREDALAKRESLLTIDFEDIRRIYPGNVPFDLRPQARGLALRIPMLILLAEESAYVTQSDADDLMRPPSRCKVRWMMHASHSVHRDVFPAFMTELEEFLVDVLRDGASA